MNWGIDESDFEDSMTHFDAVVELVDYELFENPLPTGEIVLLLYWKPLTTTGTPLKSFVHLVGDVNPVTGSPLWAQDDQFPQDGRINSTTWEIDEIYRDVYYLPADSLQSGDYQILVGWYNPENGVRLFTDADSDSFTLTTLSSP